MKHRGLPIAGILIALATGGVLVTAIGPRSALLVAGLGSVIAALAGLVALSPGRGRMKDPIPIPGEAT